MKSGVLTHHKASNDAHHIQNLLIKSWYWEQKAGEYTGNTPQIHEARFWTRGISSGLLPVHSQKHWICQSLWNKIWIHIYIPPRNVKYCQMDGKGCHLTTPWGFKHHPLEGAGIWTSSCCHSWKECKVRNVAPQSSACTQPIRYSRSLVGSAKQWCENVWNKTSAYCSETSSSLTGNRKNIENWHQITKAKKLCFYFHLLYISC